ncbi:hypothetical protein [Hugenholtzia roseola]|uniref:hypothetical protein n=1 Tax=Hugenholtzia roseola TaxID=1002 RepID=UPI0012B53157|nr:hypothetical protein [Hugenholtzia roseola]
MLFPFKKIVLLSTLFFAMSLTPSFTPSAQAQSSAVEQKASQVVVFKNGTSFFVKKVEVKPEKNKGYIADLPQALFGTFWIYGQSGRLQRITSMEKEMRQKEMQKVSSMAALLYANQGKNAHLLLETGEHIEAKIENIEGNFVFLQVLKPANSFRALSVDAIKQANFEKAPAMEVAYLTKQRVLELEFQNPQSKEEVELVYMQKNFAWLPNYSIELLDDTKARISLRASVMNDAEDIYESDLSLVVGVPNFKYSDFLEPLSSSQSVAQFLAALNGGSSDYYANRILTNAVMAQSARYEAADMLDYSMPDTEATMETSTQEDLFFYSLKKVILPKGARAFYTLFQEEVKYRHLYQTQIPTNNLYGNLDNGNQNILVSHSIEMKNTTAYPWTTGTAMVTNLNQNQRNPLSQDLLPYVAKGAEGILPLTASPEILVKHSESEIERKSGIKQKDGRTYELLTVEGVLTLRNAKEKAITLKIKRNVVGNMLKTDTTWKVDKVLANSYASAINAQNQVAWEVELGAGAEKEIRYSYQVYVAR